MDTKSTKSVRRRTGRCASILLQVLRLFLLAAAPATASGYFLGDTKAVLNGCKDHWSLQESRSMPSLLQMSVCLDVRVLAPGAWVAFSYSSVDAPRPELGLEGNEGAVYGWLLGVRHRFPVSLSLAHWHRVCLRRDVPGKSFSLELNGRLVAKRTVIAQAVPASGSLWLGCRPRQWPRGAELGQVEVYMFRMWADLARHGPCEDGTVIGWSARFWGVTSPRARQTDRNLHCAQASESGPSFSPATVSTSPANHHQSEPPSVTVTPSGPLGKTSPTVGSPLLTTLPGIISVSEGKTRLDITRSSTFTTSEVSSPPTSLAPPTDYSPANYISSSTKTLHVSSHKSNHTTIDPLRPPASNTLEINVTTVNKITPLIKDTSQYSPTTTSSTSDYNLATHYKGFAHLSNDNTIHTLHPSSNDTLDYNVTTVSEIKPLIKDSPQSDRTTLSTSDYNVATHKAFLHLPNDTRGYNLTNDFALPSADNTLEYNVTTVSAIAPLIKDTSKYNLTTLSAPDYNVTAHYKSLTTEKKMYNVTSNLLLPLVEYNATTVSTITPHIEDMPPYNLTTPSSTSVHNVTALKGLSRLINNTTMFHETTDRLPSDNSVLEYNITTVSTITPVIKDTSLYNLTPSLTSVDDVNTHNLQTNGPTVYNVTAADTSSPTDTPDLNATTLSTITYLIKDTSLDNLTTALSTLVDNVTTRKIFTKDSTVSNVTATSTTPTDLTDVHGTTVSAKIPIIQDMSQDNQTTASPQSVNNVTTHYKASLSSASRTTENNETTADNLLDMHNSTPPSKPTFTPTTADDVQLDNVTTKHYDAAAYNHTKHHQTSTDVNYQNASISSKNNKHPTSYHLTTSNNVTPPTNHTTNATIGAIDSATINNHEDTPTESTRNTVGTSRELFAQSSTTMTATTTETLQRNNTVPESSSPGAKKNLEAQADKLLEKTRDASQLNSSQVAKLVSELEKLVEAPAVSQTLAKKAVGIVSNLMEGDPLALAASSHRIVGVVEDLGLKVVVSDDPVVLSSASLVLAVRKVDGSDFPEMSVNIFNTEHVQMSNGGSRSRKRDATMASVYLPSSITEPLSVDQRKQVHRVQFTFYSQAILFQDSTLNNLTVVSPVLASSVSNASLSNLTDGIRFTIQNGRPVHANYAAVCAFWDFAMNGGAGGWSSAGCSVVSATSWGTTCTCNHLTSFAILLDLSRGGINDARQAQILTFITYIGCGLSAVFLAATLLTYLSFGKLLRDIPAKILVQLCLSLLLLNLVYLLDGWLAQYPAGGLCIGAAFFLHYFLLTSFTWAGLEALHMYLSIVRVFTPYLSRYMLKFALVGWGVPVAVVVVVISVDKDNYGLVAYGRYTDGASGEFCWLRSDAAFYAGVVAYFVLVFASCLLVFVVVLAQLARIKKQNPHNQSPQRGLAADLRSVAGLVALLGLAWGFALFAWGPLRLPFLYLFTLFNSLQGFFVFVFHCACKENVRRQWRTFLCCGHLRLAENSDWSRTAARDKRNFSVTTSSVSARQIASRSSSLVSSNSASSVFADSGMSEGSSSDVVLNELHRQTVVGC
ncbi:uncharacterized protein adgrg2a isoform X2 [Festucalex cinctus]